MRTKQHRCHISVLRISHDITHCFPLSYSVINHFYSLCFFYNNKILLSVAIPVSIRYFFRVLVLANPCISSHFFILGSWFHPPGWTIGGSSDHVSTFFLDMSLLCSYYDVMIKYQCEPIRRKKENSTFRHRFVPLMLTRQQIIFPVDDLIVPLFTCVNNVSSLEHHFCNICSITMWANYLNS